MLWKQEIGHKRMNEATCVSAGECKAVSDLDPAFDAPPKQVVCQSKCSIGLLPDAAQRYHCHVGVDVTERNQLVISWQAANPVKNLPSPAASILTIAAFCLNMHSFAASKKHLLKASEWSCSKGCMQKLRLTLVSLAPCEYDRLYAGMALTGKHYLAPAPTAGWQTAGRPGG